MWPETGGWMEKVQVPQPVHRRSTVSPRGTSLNSTREQHSLPLLVGRMMSPITLRGGQ